jgi:hypothetical protein
MLVSTGHEPAHQHIEKDTLASLMGPLPCAPSDQQKW